MPHTPETATAPAPPARVAWALYKIELQVGRRRHTWFRFAPNPIHLITSAQAACREEWPGRDDVKITDWRKLNHTEFLMPAAPTAGRTT
jgi:hypothetical protein